MSTSHTLKVSMIVAGLLAFSTSFAADKMTNDSYKAAKDRIEADYKAGKNACDPLKDNAKDICVKEAKAKEKIAKAQLEYDKTGKASDRTKVEKVKAEEQYAVAMERCEDKSGADKSACEAEAKAAEKRALSAIKAQKKATSG